MEKVNSIRETELNKELEKMQLLHNQTVDMLEALTTIPGDLYKEYARGMEQYESMYQSVELFKSSAGTEEAYDRLVGQQLSIIDKIKQFELDIQDRIKRI